MINDTSPVIEGGTDGTPIGNVGDSLKVAVSSPIIVTGPNTISPKFRAEFSSTEVSITGAAYSTFYSYAGTGYFWGLHLNMDQDGGQVQLNIDGNVIFQDITSKQLNDVGLTNVGRLFHSRAGAGSYYFYAPEPIAFNSSVVIAAKRDTGGNLKVQQRIIYISKET